MRIILNILAVILILVGVVWFLQGMNVLLGSVMTGQPQWSAFGIIAFMAGIALLFFSNRRKSSPPESDL
jgi:hypothetical protein